MDQFFFHTIHKITKKRENFKPFCNTWLDDGTNLFLEFAEGQQSTINRFVEAFSRMFDSQCFSLIFL